MPHHIGINSTSAKVAIICGAPERIPVIASYFDDPVRLTNRRGFLIYQANDNGTCLLFASAGIGGPTTAIVVEELIELGVEVIIRVGTCGGIAPNVDPGDVVISSGAVRDEGTSRQYLDLSYPAIPNPFLLSYFIEAASIIGHTHHVGVTHCKDAYYMEKPQYQLDATTVKNHWQLLRKANVVATEMEASTLFIIGGLRKVFTGALLINVGKEKAPEKERQALECIVNILKISMDKMLALVSENDHVDAIKEDISYLDR